MPDIDTYDPIREKAEQLTEPPILYSVCCGAEPRASTELTRVGKDVIGLCPECHDWTGFDPGDEY